MNFKEYQSKMNQAKSILNAILGEPKDHKEWAERFNQAAKIIPLLGKQ